MIYLDNHSTTPCDPRVVEAMLPYFSEIFGNPSSPHLKGIEAANAIKEARSKVANLIGAENEEVIFTSGATESNNLAILGAAAKHESIGGKRRRIVTTAIEHKSVLEACNGLAERGWEIICLPVDNTGRVILDLLDTAINEETLLVSMQVANSEIGTIQPIKEITALAHQKGALVHCDAAQAVGKIPVDVKEWEVDMLSMSGHKIYGPKGIGALYLSGGAKKLPLIPIMRGGRQESGLRPGTLPVPLIVGIGVACDICFLNMPEETKKMSQYRDLLEELLLNGPEPIKINGNKENRLAGNSNITFYGFDAELLQANLPELILSTGSACESGTIEPSRTLLNLGLNHEDASSAIRFGIGRFNTQEEVVFVADSIISACKSLHLLLK